jgi:hypothetical protein
MIPISLFKMKRARSCEQDEFCKYPCYIVKGGPKGRFCGPHKSKKCEEDGCTTRPHFNKKGESGFAQTIKVGIW